MTQKTATRDVYEIITSRIIQKLEQGIIPWKQPWTEAGIPQNLITRKPYRGINLLLLSSLGYSTNYYLTRHQLEDIGGTVKPDQKPELIVFWKWPEDKKDSPDKPKPILRYYQIYNVEQCELLDKFIPEGSPFHENNPIVACAEIVENMPKKPDIKSKENRAYYHPFFDYINMPKMEKFIDSESYYDTLFHELIHSTGHITRLNRKEMVYMKSMGADAYSFEELVAEIGACFLDSVAGMGNIHFDNNAAYISSWINALKGDKRFIIDASAKAQKAVDFILNVQTPDNEGAGEIQVSNE
jgi:antirestriction protein ArdC